MNTTKQEKNYTELLELKKCINCNETFNTKDMLLLDDGEYSCEGCTFDKCSWCSKGECEVETHSGDYICIDCHSGSIDNAYESMRD